MLRCILCLNKTFQYNFKSLKSTQSCGLTVKELIQLHFYFHSRIFDDSQHSFEYILCEACWGKLDSFHEFYRFVKVNHGITDGEKFNPPDEAEVSQASDGEDNDWLERPIKTEFVEENYEEVRVKCEIDENVFGEDFANEDTEENFEENSSQDANFIDDQDWTPPIKISKKSVKKEKSREPKPKKEKGQKAKTDKKETAVLTEEDEELIRQNATLDCNLCSYKFKGWYDAQKHNRTHKQKNFMRCCGRKFDRISDMLDHVNWHRDPTIFTCRVCGKVMNARDLWEIHESRHVPPELRQFECPEEGCDKKFGSAATLMFHKRTHRIGKLEASIPCKSCDKMFKTETALKVHFTDVHDTNASFMCEFCSRVFSRKQALEYHKKSHLDQPEPTIQCNICGHYVKNQTCFLVHMRRHKDAENGPYPCEKCKEQGIEKEFKDRRLLRAHIKFVHTPYKFRCEECGKEFKHKQSYTEHLSQHTGIDQYSCNFCSRTFKSNANMYNHRKRVHPEEHAAMLPPPYLRPPEEHLLPESFE